MRVSPITAFALIWAILSVTTAAPVLTTDGQPTAELSTSSDYDTPTTSGTDTPPSNSNSPELAPGNGDDPLSEDDDDIFLPNSEILAPTLPGYSPAYGANLFTDTTTNDINNNNNNNANQNASGSSSNNKGKAKVTEEPETPDEEELQLELQELDLEDGLDAEGTVYGSSGNASGDSDIFDDDEEENQQQA